MNYNRNLLTWGIILLIIGVVTVIISQAVTFTKVVPVYDPWTEITGKSSNFVQTVLDDDKKQVVFGIGIFFIIVGGVLFAVSFSQNKNGLRSINNLSAQDARRNQNNVLDPNQNPFIFCSNCGKKYDNELAGQYCQDCGTKL